MDTVVHKVRRNGSMVPLGPTEFRLLRHFLEHPGWVFSRERLLDSVWGQDTDIELRSVDVHIRRLRKAINVNGAPDIIRTVRSAGFVVPGALGIQEGGYIVICGLLGISHQQAIALSLLRGIRAVYPG